ncbi:TKL/TKL-ccin protein kinase, variant 2 [Coprinopsis cinerea AmutBmut pab1-1]|nr:TKL/TKL-ccin protein kinase, variant 2 [Coprinopsis cinerea AmutBmut pab1-1]
MTVPYTPQPHLTISLGMSLAQITAQFAPLPGYNFIVDALCAILQCCDNVVQNRYAARQLATRCHAFVQSLKDTEMKGLNPNLVAAKKAVERELTLIRGRMDKWSRMGKIKSFLSQDDVSREIMECHTAISDCISKFQLQSQIEIFEWQKEHEANTRLDHQELVSSMARLQDTQDATQDLARENNEMLRTLMGMMQMAMGENKQIAEAIQQGLSLNLYQLQKQSSELLPNRNLSSGEVKRIGEFPVAGTATMDIYEGLYLGKEKVSMKAIRAMKADEKSRHRFNREGEIWAKVWQKDRGQYIVPFYGFCQTDGPFPYMVSPWQENGDALTYVKANDHKINYRDFVSRPIPSLLPC